MSEAEIRTGEIVASGAALSGKVVGSRVVHVPSSIDEAVSELNGLDGLLTASEWHRAAIVYAFTRDGQGKRTDLGTSSDFTGSSSLNVTEFAALGIAGLKSDQTVRTYRKAWQAAINVGKAAEIGPGDPVEMPNAPWVVNVERLDRVREEAPDLADRVERDGLPLSRAERIVRDRQAEQKKVAEARAEAEAVGVTVTVDIREGDFREVLADVANIDAIITDPPYPAEYLPLLTDLAAWADKVLTEDGVLAVLLGQTHLNEAYRLLDGHRPYRWTACYLTSGPGYVSHPRKVQSNWKPIIVYGKGPRFSDVIHSVGSDADAKDKHQWGQDYSAFHTLIQRLTRHGQTVADPFMGSGGALLAAYAQGRHVIGCDTNPVAVSTARERVA